MNQKQQKEKYDLLVIGGGPSGMMAAGVAAENGKKVLLLEKNSELGKKLKITGGGRCNITNATYDVRSFLLKFGDAGKFLHSTFSQFDIRDTFTFFESRDLPMKIEPGNRAFPKTEKALDVFKVMEKYIDHKNITVLKNCSVEKISVAKQKGVVNSVETNKGIYVADNYIIATGGTSHPETGSTGDGFGWLEKIGHSVHTTSPNIVPLKVRDKWVKSLSGTSLSDIKITFSVNNKRIFSRTGKILFTHFGISGPLILNSAHRVSDMLHEGIVTATIDTYPKIDIGVLEKNILGIFDENKNKSFKNIIKQIAPNGLTQTILDLNIIKDPEVKVHSVSKEQRKELANALKSLSMQIVDLMGMDRAVVSGGGIPLEEIDTKTMRSKIFSNLYLTGDILHINRPSGGYSLQLCWTTGHVAGTLQ
ncbi:aminoacetone oxidase family FAD-binding enzyme [Candidatus Wolfebacteria bacterium]|nr:MAG: aminoacetone oxidase family FAD-binding enzyme [Candidatus Wolfebacteria bacterium]